MRLADSIVLGCVVVATGMLSAEEIHPDWKAKVDTALSGSSLVTIPKNEIWVADEDDMTNHINRLTERKLLVRGTLVLDNVKTWFKKTNAFYVERDTQYQRKVVKRGVSVLKQTNNQINFEGTFVVSGGTFQITADYPMCADKANCALIVEDGATLHFKAASGTSPRLGTTPLYITGTGVNGDGAVIVDAAGARAIPKLVLNGDATVVLNTSTQMFDSFEGSGAYGAVDPASIDFNGHKLTIGGTASTVSIGKVVTKDAGTVELLPLASGGRTLSISSSATNLSDMDLSGVASIVFAGDSTLRFAISCPALTAALSAAGDLTITQSSTPVSSTVAGDIQMASGKTLTIVPYSSTRTITLGGTVSGPCNVQVGTSGTPAAGAVVFAGENDYTGTLAAYGSGNLKVYLGYPLADWNKLSVSGAIVNSRPGLDAVGQPRWTDAEVVGLAARQGLPKISVDAGELTGGTEFEIRAATVKGNDTYKTQPPAWDSFGADGRYSLSGPYGADYPLNIDLYSGTIRLTGLEQIVLGSVVVSGTSAANSGTLLLDGANVSYADQKINVGSLDQNLTTPVGRIVVTNSTLVSSSYSSSYSGGAMNLGKYSTGILEVEAGSVVSNRFYLGGGIGSTAEGYAYGVGAVFQRGGTVVPFGSGSTPYCSSVGYYNNAFGYYELAGGLLRPRGGFIVGNWSGGLLVQTGGTAIFSELGLSVQNGGRSTYCVRGGTTIVSNVLQLATANDVGVVVTVHGKDALFSVYDSSTRGIVYAAVGNAANTSIININDGGVFQAAAINKYQPSYTKPYPVIVNFNGGIMKATDFNWGLLGGGQGLGGNNGPLSKVAIYEKGAAIDSNGINTETVSAIEGAGVGGIASIRLASPVSCAAAPEVLISGDGYGATAIAEFDSRLSQITNILITSRGWGYTKGGTTIKLRYNQYSVVKTISTDDFEIADNGVGGFTKLGAGTLTLTAGRTNTWEKWTRVVAGTLKAGAEKSVPDGTELQLNGGTLDLNNTSVSFSGVSGTGGAVINGTVAVTGTRTVDIADLNASVADPTPVYDADIVFCPGSKIVFTNSELLNPEVVSTYRLFKIGSGCALSGLPAVEGLPDDWTFRLTATGAKISYNKGIVLIVR